MDRHVAPLWHIILIPSQPVFVLSPQCCVLCEEATNTNFIIFGLTRPVLEPTIYRTRGEHANYYATDAVELHLMCGLHRKLVDQEFTSQKFDGIIKT